MRCRVPAGFCRGHQNLQKRMELIAYYAAAGAFLGAPVALLLLSFCCHPPGASAHAASCSNSTTISSPEATGAPPGALRDLEDARAATARRARRGSRDSRIRSSRRSPASRSLSRRFRPLRRLCRKRSGPLLRACVAQSARRRRRADEHLFARGYADVSASPLQDSSRPCRPRPRSWRRSSGLAHARIVERRAAVNLLLCDVARCC